MEELEEVALVHISRLMDLGNYIEERDTLRMDLAYAYMGLVYICSCKSPGKSFEDQYQEWRSDKALFGNSEERKKVFCEWFESIELKGYSETLAESVGSLMKISFEKPVRCLIINLN